MCGVCEYNLILHGILADKDWEILMKLILVTASTPILPQSEPKECWMDRKAYSLYQKKKIDAIYLEKWR